MKSQIKYILLTLAGLLLCGTALAQQCTFNIDPDNLAFAVGEKLTYRVTYSASIIRTDIADVEITTSKERIGSTDCYKLYGIGKTRPFYGIFFEMEDIYISWLDCATLRPLRMTSELKEGGYRYRQAFDFDWDKKNVHTMGHNIKRDRTYHKDMALQPCSYDALSLFFNMRSNDDIFKMKKDERITLDLVLEDTIRTIQLRMISRENKKVDGLGEFRTLKYGCQIATATDQSFKDGTEFFIWLTDDRNRIPVHLETPIKVGKVTAVLSGWSGLQHPFESVVVPRQNR